MDKVHFIRTGVPYNVFSRLRKDIPFNDDEWALLLDISLKSLQRYIKNETHVFKLTHSERILEVVEVCDLGLEVFGSKDKFYEWSKIGMPVLNNIPPIDLMRDSYGKSLVMDELNAIDHGVFA